MASESHNARLGGIKQDIQDFKSDFNPLLSSLNNEIQLKFDNISTRLNQIESNLESNITDQVNESILSVKDSIITALRDDNKMPQVKVEILEKTLAESEKYFNKLDQYNRRNNFEIQGIPSTVGDEVLEDKVIEIFECLNIPLAKSDIEDCHWLGKSNPKNTIVRFANRKNCYAALSKKLDLRHIDKVNHGFPEKQIYFLMKIWLCIIRN